MICYIAKTVPGSFDSVIADVTARLSEQEFGIVADIDVQATLESNQRGKKAARRCPWNSDPYQYVLRRRRAGR